MDECPFRFTLANTAHNIIGAEFLSHFRLLPDLSNNRLISVSGDIMSWGHTESGNEALPQIAQICVGGDMSGFTSGIERAPGERHVVANELSEAACEGLEVLNVSEKKESREKAETQHKSVFVEGNTQMADRTKQIRELAGSNLVKLKAEGQARRRPQRGKRTKILGVWNDSGRHVVARKCSFIFPEIVGNPLRGEV